MEYFGCVCTKQFALYALYSRKLWSVLLRPKTKTFNITETLLLGKVVMVQRGFGWQYTFQHYTMQGRGGSGAKKNSGCSSRGKSRRRKCLKTLAFPFPLPSKALLPPSNSAKKRNPHGVFSIGQWSWGQLESEWYCIALCMCRVMPMVMPMQW